MQITRTVYVTTGVLVCLATSQFARASTDFDYPELMVTPRASDRLEVEAGKEEGRRWIEHLPIMASGITTLTAGILQFSNADPTKTGSTSALAGVIVGGGWVATTAAMALMYRPYTSAQREIGPMGRKTPREQLTRERFAEEAFRSQSRLASRLKWLSVASNLGANIYMLTQATSGSIGVVADGVAAAMALAPLIFRPHWQDVSEEQENYKKRIYAPVASATIFSEPGTGAAVPGLAISMSF